MAWAEDIVIAELPGVEEYDEVIAEASQLLAALALERAEVIAEEMKTARILLAFDDNARIVGACIMQTYSSEAYVEYLGVEECRQDEGIGRRLMDATESVAMESGKKSVDLIFEDASLIDYYKKLGFKVVFSEEDEVYRADKSLVAK